MQNSTRPTKIYQWCLGNEEFEWGERRGNRNECSVHLIWPKPQQSRGQTAPTLEPDRLEENSLSAACQR